MSFAALPIELVRKILRLATNVPGLLDTEYNSDGPVEEARQIEVQLAVALPNKLSLSLVSKSWNAIMNEFLYEGIIVKHFKHMAGLVALLGRPLTDLPPRGRWVKYLALEFHLSEILEVSSADLARLWGLLPLCSNVVVLRLVPVSPPRRHLPSSDSSVHPEHLDIPTHLLANIAEFVGGTLRRIELGKALRFPDVALLPFLRQSNDLQSLSILGPFYHIESSPTPKILNHSDRNVGPAGALLGKLHTLGINHPVPALADLATGSLPALRHLALSYHVEQDIGDPRVHLARSVAARITTLELGSGADLHDTWQGSVVGYLLNLLPHVEHLIMHNPKELRHLTPHMQHSRLAIITAYDYMDAAWIKHGCEDPPMVYDFSRGMLRLTEKDRFPSLRKICLRHASYDPEPVEIWYMRQFHAAGIEWEVTPLLDEEDVRRGGPRRYDSNSSDSFTGEGDSVESAQDSDSPTGEGDSVDSEQDF